MFGRSTSCVECAEHVEYAECVEYVEYVGCAEYVECNKPPELNSYSFHQCSHQTSVGNGRLPEQNLTAFHGLAVFGRSKETYCQQCLVCTMSYPS